MSAEPAARLIGVSHRYGKRAALRDVSLAVAPGRMLGLIGPDGVGKSTLLGLIAGVRRIQTGAVAALGGDMRDAGHRAGVCARIAYMPQGLGKNLYPTLSVRENIDFFGRLYGQGAGERARRIDELLHATGLDPFPDRPAGKLSGGMKQKLSLCCALIHDPDLLIMDEPTAGVDPLSRKQFWELIDRIRARRAGLTVITATACMSEAERFDDLVAMDDGRILATGAPAAIKESVGADTLEAAFVALLPPEKRDGHGAVIPPACAPHDGPPAIEAKGLSMRFGDFTAVDTVDFAIERGEIFGFLGSNGCGKTTTMKMLTGLLRPSEGAARLFGEAVNGGDMSIRRRVGYMSQSFSLYGELSVRQNLALHADLFAVARARRAGRIAELLDRFDLARVADARPEGLPLGVRQRLQLAVAILHEPEILILDEPTSGVDPIARDRFWELLIALSRDDGVTIFISTHFMNEAERCDRISLMHAGKVLAIGRPADLRAARGAATLEDAFIGYLEDAAPPAPAPPTPPPPAPPPPPPMPPPPKPPEAHRRAAAPAWFSPSRAWAFAWREGLELIRDPIRLAFALLGPVALMLAMGFAISFDVENLAFATLDQDQSPESRMLKQEFAASRYFDEGPPLRSFTDLDARMRQGDIALALVIPPDFGRDLLAGHRPEIAAWLDGSVTARAETARGYVQGVYVQGVYAAWLKELSHTETGHVPRSIAAFEPRFRYNQAFRSANAIPPGGVMMMLIMIPAMLTALGVVREKELGSICNLYAAPARKFEFLLGKQAPYGAVAMVSFVILTGVMRAAFGLSPVGSVTALVIGAALYTTAATAFGLVISCFVRSQIAAVFASAIIVMVPTVNFSGMLYPVATLTGGAKLFGQSFPPLYFQRISAGVYNKGLSLVDLAPDMAMLALFCAAFWALATMLLSKQEA